MMNRLLITEAKMATMTTVGGGTGEHAMLPKRWGLDAVCWNRMKRNPCRSYGYDLKRGLSLRVTVKATGGAKFMGTQMREKQLTEMIEQKVMEAKEVCEGDEKSDECRVAWDEVEEVSQAKADLRLKLQSQDPLEYYCQDNPEADECRLYED